MAPVMLFALVPLLLVEDDIYTKKLKSIKVFGHSYLVFFIFNLTTTWWIWNASAGGAAMAVIANSLLMAITFQLFHFVKKRIGRREGYLGLVILWISFEYVHYHWDISWPWLNLGNAFANMPELVQWYSYSGVLGGTLWILICNITIFSIYNNLKNKKETFSHQTPLLILLGVAIIFPIGFSIGSYMNYEHPTNPVNIIVTQPNIDTYKEKFGDFETKTPMMPLTEQLDRSFDIEGVNYHSADLILAPETAIVRPVFERKISENFSYKYLSEKIKKYNNPNLFIGASSVNIGKEKIYGSRKVLGQNFFETHYNAGLLIQTQAEPSICHKSELVLGVEKLPFTSFLPVIEDWAISLGGASGSLGKPEHLANLKSGDMVFAPAICYESIYGSTCAEFVNKGAEIITIITNDDWWGDTPGYKQHFDFARLRAIENRRYVARSANTGFSGFISPRGDVIAKTNFKEQTALQAEIHRISEKTFYTQYGDFIGRSLAFVAVLLVVFGMVKMIRNKIKVKTSK